MTYRVVHRTHYEYESDVSASYGEAHLHPRETQSQQTYSATLTVDPFPEHYRERRDFFGNRVAHFTVLEPHRVLTVTATSMVDVRDRRAILPVVGDLSGESRPATCCTVTPPSNHRRPPVRPRLAGGDPVGGRHRVRPVDLRSRPTDGRIAGRAVPAPAHGVRSRPAPPR